MEQALDQARLALDQDEVPIGALIVFQGQVVAAAHNLTRKACDPTGHAEMRVIRASCQKLRCERLVGCDLYVTVEPCPMCAAAISFARIRRLYYGASDKKGGAVESGSRFFLQPTCHHAPEIYAGLCEIEASSLLQNFFATKRGATCSIHSGQAAQAFLQARAKSAQP